MQSKKSKMSKETRCKGSKNLLIQLKLRKMETNKGRNNCYCY